MPPHASEQEPTNQRETKEQVQAIIDAFINALQQEKGSARELEKIRPETFLVHSPTCMRTPAPAPAEATSEISERDREAQATHDPFIALFFANAPKTNGTAILAEKKHW